jgi:hypothetical protein
MDLALLIVSFGGVVITAIAAAAAIVQARTAVTAKTDAETARSDAIDARNESRAARNEAATLAAEANDAFKRQAAALEESNRLQRELLPKDEVRWVYEHVQGVLYVLHNTGSKTARNALISEIGDSTGWVRPAEDVARDVPSGGGLEFHVVSAFGAPRPQFRVTWTEDDSDEEFHDDTRMVIRN